MPIDPGIASLLSGLRVAVAPVTGLSDNTPPPPMAAAFVPESTTESTQWAPVTGSRAVFTSIKLGVDEDPRPAARAMSFPVVSGADAPRPAEPPRPAGPPPAWMPPTQDEGPAAREVTFPAAPGEMPPRPQAAPQPPPEAARPTQPAPAPVPAPRVEITDRVAEEVAGAGLGQLRKMLKALGVQPGPEELEFNLADNTLHPMVLDVLFTAFFSDEWYDWEAETLDNALREITAAGGGEISIVNRTKLLAMSALHASTYAWVSMMPFAKIALALDSRVPDFELLEPVHPGTMLCALSVMRGVNPAHGFSHEVLRYIATSCVHDGLMIFPDPVVGDLVNQAVARLVDRSVSRDEYLVLEGLWKRFSAAGGPAESMTRDLDEMDESNLGDYQFSQASRAVAYVAEFEAKLAKQYAALARWAAQGN